MVYGGVLNCKEREEGQQKRELEKKRERKTYLNDGRDGLDGAYEKNFRLII